MDAPKRKTLVIFPGALGDFVCFLPALQKIIRCHQRVDVFARSDYAGLVAGVSVRSIERREISRLFSVAAEDDEGLRAFFSNYENIYSWLGGQEPNFVTAIRRIFKGNVRCFPFRPRDRVHATDYYLSCVGATRAPSNWHEILDLDPAARTWAKNYSRKHAFEQRNVLMLGPGSGGREKNWPARAYRDIADWWESRMRGLVVTLLGPAEEEDREIIKNFNANAFVLKGLAVDRIAALLAHSNLYLGNDSGLTHLSAALGTKTVAIFGPTDSVRWAPRGRNVKVISLGVPCSPCDYATMKTCSHHRCLTTLAVKQVTLGIAEWINSTGADGSQLP